MGKQLFEMYDEAKHLGGLMAQIRLAVLTMLPATKALEAPDSAENLEKFNQAMKTVRQEFSLTQKV